MLTFKYWTSNVTTLRESLARKGFALASAGLVQQGAIVATIEAGPLAYKGGSTLSHDPSNRRLVLTINNSKAPNDNLNEILSTLDIAGISSKELIERVDVVGTALLSSSVEPVKIIQKIVPKAVVDGIRTAINRDVSPIGIRVGSTNSPADIFEKPHLSLLIEPLFSDIKSKFLVRVDYNSSKIDDAGSFLTSLFLDIQRTIQAMAG